ncbi:NADPH dehydrogenase NamA [Paenibacillus sp. YYML68]|uniref:NADPH dehydrogenase NamA n=1 Tax=Paenibacillus sp. YYML68 TaxID=2909250 RepID=UPI002491FBBC|nr:NADPH dehydrogenase NamA [Paenibacillus sp. YYML68]
MLFTSYTMKELTLKNRIVMSPMCMYACDDESGRVNNWHKVHYPSRAVGQVGLIIVEATAVTPQGRISAQDLGIWSDEHVEGLKELTSLVHSQGAHIGIQLAHAGRKALVEGPILAPSAIPFDEKHRTPEAMTEQHIAETITAFAEAARRAKEAGFDVIELHAAHGYLINEFLSPLTNKRTDAYGGDKDRRYQLLNDVIDAVKQQWSGPLFVRISAHDYHPEGLTPDDYVDYARRMKAQGVDLIDVSSGAVLPAVPPNIYPGFQAAYAAQLRKEAEVATGAVGIITQPELAESILASGQADLVLLGRELLRDPYWPRTAAKQLGVTLEPPKSYNRGW